MPGAVLIVLLCASQLYLVLLTYRRIGVVAPAGIAVRNLPCAPLGLVDYCRRNGLRAGYGTYWIGCLATFLSDEALVLAPYRGKRFGCVPTIPSVD
jgi:hypothetical protein